MSVRTNASELARAIGTPDGVCPKCGGGVWYRPILSSSAFVCNDCTWLTFDRADLTPDKGVAR